MKPEVQSLRVNGLSAVLQLMISPDLAYFPGHFPNLPILPGVVQVHWAIQFARAHLSIPESDFSELRALKFSSPVLPGSLLFLRMDWLSAKQRLDFMYHNEHRTFSSGQVVFVAGEAR